MTSFFEMLSMVYPRAMYLRISPSRFESENSSIAALQTSSISDEAAGYLAGSKTVEEASKLIQSRVSLYIQEQK